MKNLFLLSILISMLFGSVFSQNVENKFKTKTVSIFKNGTAFFQKEITANTDKNNSITTKLPFAGKTAIFGSIWFEAQGNNILKIESNESDITLKVNAYNILSMLKANISKTLTLSIASSLDEIAFGKQIEVT